MKKVTRINLWSGPRNISTAIMYSFAQRNDTQVVDEPLYSHYLRVSGANHPGKEEVLNSQENDGEKVIQHLLSTKWKKPIVFFKQMTHHLVNLSMDFLSRTKNILLIRDPKEVLLSYSKVIEQPKLEDIGIQQSYDLWNFLEAKNFHRLVVDANEVLQQPQKLLTKVCEHVGIEFDPSMLRWKPGAREEDGVWAKHWYANVHQSTGFAPFEKEEKELPEHLKNIYHDAKPFYDFLFQVAVKA